MVALGSEREEERMRLLILANTLPILVEANDQGPLTAPQLFSPSCASCARSRINQKRTSFEKEVEEQRREYGKGNQLIAEDVWARGSCLSSTPTDKRELRKGDARDSQLTDDVDSGVWSEGTDKESVSDSKEENVNNLDASHKRNVTDANTAAEANAFIDEVQKQVKEKIELMTRLEGRMEAMQDTSQRLEKAKRENGRMEQRLRDMEEENRVLRIKLLALEKENAVALQETTESHPKTDCCREACASLRAMIESLKEERSQRLQGEEGQEKLVTEKNCRLRMQEAESLSVVKHTDEIAVALPGSARVILAATISVIIAFAYLQLYCLNLNRETKFPM